jgi:hypothetical protein
VTGARTLPDRLRQVHGPVGQLVEHRPAPPRRLRLVGEPPHARRHRDRGARVLEPDQVLERGLGRRARAVFGFQLLEHPDVQELVAALGGDEARDVHRGRQHVLDAEFGRRRREQGVLGRELPRIGDRFLPPRVGTVDVALDRIPGVLRQRREHRLVLGRGVAGDALRDVGRHGAAPGQLGQRAAPGAAHGIHQEQAILGDRVAHAMPQVPDRAGVHDRHPEGIAVHLDAGLGHRCGPRLAAERSVLGVKAPVQEALVVQVLAVIRRNAAGHSSGLPLRGDEARLPRRQHVLRLLDQARRHRGRRRVGAFRLRTAGGATSAAARDRAVVVVARGKAQQQRAAQDQFQGSAPGSPSA